MGNDSQARHRVRKSEGIYQDRWGYAAVVTVGDQRREKRYPLGTSFKTMQQWRDETRVAFRQAAPQRRRGTFARDAEVYLKTVQHLPTYSDRKRIVGYWVDEFGHRARTSITTVEIDQVLSRWLANKKAPGTVRQRRSVLLHLWHKLDGHGAPNPVRDTLKPEEPTPEARAIDYKTVEAILAAMADHGRCVPGQRLEGNQTRARLRVIAYTGMSHIGLKQLKPADIDWDARTVRVYRRRKGKGAPGGPLPLTDNGLAALREFAALNCWGDFSNSAMWKAFQRACDKLGLHGLRPYDLRHSFGTEMYRVTGDPRVPQRILQHASPKMTERYTLGADDERLKVAVKAFDKRFRVAVPRGSTRDRRKKTA